MVEFRKADLSDWNKIKKIAHNTWPATFGNIISKEQIMYMLKMHYNKESLQKQIGEFGHHFLLAEEGKRPVGFISYEINYKSKPQLMIHKLYILPNMQGLGIGIKFLDLMSETALKNNNHQLCLKVYYKNIKAIRFYKKYGFVKSGIKTLNIGNGYKICDHVMIKKIGLDSFSELF